MGSIVGPEHQIKTITITGLSCKQAINRFAVCKSFFLCEAVNHNLDRQKALQFLGQAEKNKKE